jgi:hypothetical protein
MSHPADDEPAVPTSGSGRAGAAIAVGVLAAAVLSFVLLKPKPLKPPTPALAPTPGPTPIPGTAAPPPLSATAPFDPVGAQQRILDGASPDRTVTVRSLQAGMKSGRDLPRFSVRASHAGFLYVQMVGSDRGKYALIFPNALDKDNHIAAGQTITLPRLGWKLGAGGPAAIGYFVAIVSDAPRQFRGAGLQDGSPFSTFPIERAAKLQHSYTGPTPLFAGLPECADPAVCPETYGATMFSIREAAR